MRPGHLRLLHPGEPAPRNLARSLLERCSFPAGSDPPVGFPCAVSGGADSLALLVLASEAGLRPVAYHVDHGLRPGSASEVALVEEAAAVLGAREPTSGPVEVVSLRVELAPGPNLEARARAARFSVLPGDVATGHTADDQGETVLINLLRGSAAAGLAGMAPGGRHPILGIRRADTRAVCREAGIEWMEDPSNEDRAPLRNRVRHELIPALNELSGRDVVPVLCRQAGLLSEDEAFLSGLASVLDPTSARELTEAPRPLARRAVRAWLKQATAAEHPPSSAAVERVLEVAAGSVRACEIAGGVSVRRSKGRLVLHGDGVPEVQ